MRDTELFQQALGLTPPWHVTRTEFDPELQQLDLYIDFAPGGTFACPECAAPGCKAHDTEEKSWRHLNFFQHQAYTACPHATRALRALWCTAGCGALGAAG